MRPCCDATIGEMRTQYRMLMRILQTENRRRPVRALVAEACAMEAELRHRPGWWIES
jgi:hypothetical protein